MRERRPLDEPEIVRRLRAGESQRAVGSITAEALRRSQPENNWRDNTLIPYARLRGWRWHFTQRSDKSPAGWVDVVFCRPPRLVLAELKAEGKYPTPAQRGWLSLLRQCPGVECYLWRPRDWVEIQEVLA